MKLSKKNQARQRAIRKAIASGKSVGGLLAGALALATTGCSPRSAPGPIGRFPDPSYETKANTNACNQTPPVQTTPGEAPPPKPPAKPSRQQKPGRTPMQTMGIMVPQSPAKTPTQPGN